MVQDAAPVAVFRPSRDATAADAGLRLNGTWFVIAPHEEHFFPEVERIVAQDVHYWVLERHGKAGEVAEKLDPRNRQA